MTAKEGLLVGTIAFAAGAAITYVMFADSSADTVTPPIGEGLSYDEAQVYVENYQLDTARSNFFYLSDEIVGQLAYVEREDLGGDGYVIYFGATGKASDYDATVIARVTDITTPDRRSVIESYTVFDNSTRRNSGICPYMCDKELTFDNRD